MKIKAHGVLRVLMILVLVTLAVTLFSFVVRWLWNWLMPALFGLHVVSFWQALGLLVLSKILFSGFHGRHGFGRDRQMRLIRRWEQMTPEEREAFRAGLRGGCGPAGASPVAPKA
jgi:energy-coupling factor transporter transmembrane protein EcfT